MPKLWSASITLSLEGAVLNEGACVPRLINVEAGILLGLPPFLVVTPYFKSENSLGEIH